MRLTLSFLLCSFLVLSAAAQQTNSWSLYKATNGIEIYYQQVNCTTNNAPSQVAYILKVVNTTTIASRVSWDLKIWYNNEEVVHNVTEGENHMTVEVDANREVVGTCETPYGALYIFKDFITYVSPTKLTRFELENIQVTKI